MIRSTLCATALVAGVACTGGIPGGGDDQGDDTNPPHDPWDDVLASREVDYSSALRTAALKLTGDLPTLDEIHQVADPTDVALKKAAYEALVQAYMGRPTFAIQMFHWWQNTLKAGDAPDLDQAAAFAAQITVENRSYDELLTATAGQCGSFDEGTSTFTAGDCQNGVPVHAGLLTQPGVMRQYVSNFAFRRVKWVQETFDCLKFPVEISATPVDVGGSAPYTGVHPFASVPSLATGRVNFQDTSSVICANCHTTMNHIAPLFAYFDENGAYQTSIAVKTPLTGAPLAELSDYLAPGETYQWRYGVQTPDLPALGRAMAADPSVAACAVARVWNLALDKGDVVDAAREVPMEVMQAQLDAFNAGGHKLRDLVYAVFTADDFVKY